VPKAPPMASSVSSPIAGPSNISNAGTSIAALVGPSFHMITSTSLYMPSPLGVPLRTFGEGPLAFARQNASRPLSSEQKASASASSRPSTSEAGSSSQQNRPSNRPPSNIQSSKFPAPPQILKHEIIEISSDSDSDSPPPTPPPKRETKPKTSIPSQARKSTGGQQPRRSSPPKRKDDHEVIEILDSDDEVAKPQVATGKSKALTNEMPKSAKISENASTSKLAPEDGMDIDHSSDAPVEVVAPSAKVDIGHAMRPNREHNVPAATDMAVSLRWTPSPLPAKLEPATPAHAQPSPLQPQSSPTSIKKPNRQGFNPISIPDNITLPPAPKKRRLQTAVKSTSDSFKQREISPSSSPASTPTGESESEESSDPNSRDSMSAPEPDLRNLANAFRINSTRDSSPEPQVLAKKPPSPPKATKPSVSISPQLIFHQFSHAATIGILQT